MCLCLSAKYHLLFRLASADAQRRRHLQHALETGPGAGVQLFLPEMPLIEASEVANFVYSANGKFAGRLRLYCQFHLNIQKHQQNVNFT